MTGLKKQSQRSSQTLKTALWGCGGAAEAFYLPALKRHPELFSVNFLCDPDDAAIKQFQTEFPMASVVQSMQELPANLDLVIIASPPASQAKQAVEALSSGFSVASEIPVALNSDEAQAILDLTNKSGKILTPALLHRYYPAPRAIKDLLASNLLGKLQSFTLRCGQKFHWNTRTSSFFKPAETAAAGVLTHYGYYLLDLVHWFFGDVEEVEMFDDATTGPEANCWVNLHMPDGAVGEIRLSWDCDTMCGMRIDAERGAIEWDLESPAQFFLVTNSNRRITCSESVFIEESAWEHTPHATSPPSVSAAADKLSAYSMFLADAANSILHGKPGKATVSDMVACSQLLGSCYAARVPLPQPWIHAPGGAK